MQELEAWKTQAKRDHQKLADDLAEVRQQYGDLEVTCQALRTSTDEAKIREEVWRTKLDKARDRYDLLEGDRVHWHRRELELAKSFLTLEDQLEKTTKELSKVVSDAAEKKSLSSSTRSKQPQNGSTAVFGAILIELTASLVS